jgi:L-lactate dehydrogenase complex protein LldE
VARRFLDRFAGPAEVVAPSASCVAMVRAYPGLFAPGTPDHARAVDLAGRVFELSDFLANRLGLADLGARFDGSVAFHASCQAEGLGITGAARRLLAGVRGLEVREPARMACCGFGGGFSLAFPDISRAILEEKAADLSATGASLVTAVEPSCLTHMEGFFRGQGLPLRTAHLAEILAQGLGLGAFVDASAGNATPDTPSGGRA